MQCFRYDILDKFLYYKYWIIIWLTYIRYTQIWKINCKCSIFIRHYYQLQIKLQHQLYSLPNKWGCNCICDLFRNKTTACAYTPVDSWSIHMLTFKISLKCQQFSSNIYRNSDHCDRGSIISPSFSTRTYNIKKQVS